jgi:nucleoside-diphosphate-sugar epimerase
VKVFVTGGTGLVGRHVIGQLVARGDTVTALARSASAAEVVRRLGATPREGDVTDAAALDRGAQGADAVVHAAAILLEQRDWETFRAMNVAPVEAIARAAGRTGARLVHISSVAAYGRRTVYDGGPGSVSEEFGLDRPIFAGDHYARSKREAELVLWRVAEETGLRAVALRPCVIYGEGDRAFAPRVARALRIGVAPLVGDGTNVLSVVYAGNVAAAVLGALDGPAVTGAFNVANDGRLTQRQFVEAFARGLGRRVRFVRVPKGPARAAAQVLETARRIILPGGNTTTLMTAVHFLGSENPYTSARAAAELGWRPVTGAAEAAERTGRWFRDHASA